MPKQIIAYSLRVLAAGTRFGQLATNSLDCLEIRDEIGDDVVARYFRVAHGELLTNRPMMPAMLTHNEQVIRQDCLCYIMERLAY